MAYLCPKHHAELLANPARLPPLIAELAARAEVEPLVRARLFTGAAFEACLLWLQGGFSDTALRRLAERGEAHAELLAALELYQEREHCLWLHHRSLLEALDDGPLLRQHHGWLLPALAQQEQRLVEQLHQLGRQDQAAHVQLTSRHLRQAAFRRHGH